MKILSSKIILVLFILSIITALSIKKKNDYRNHLVKNLNTLHEQKSPLFCNHLKTIEIILDEIYSKKIPSYAKAIYLDFFYVLNIEFKNFYNKDCIKNNKGSYDANFYQELLVDLLNLENEEKHRLK